MRKIITTLGFGVIFLGVVACQTTKSLPPGVSPVQATWLYGKVGTASRVSKKGYLYNYTSYPPDGDPWLPILKGRLKPGAVAPAVIWLHGCTGHTNQTALAIRTFQLLGYTVFAPDSFARPGRSALCGMGGMDDRVSMRHEELKYALSQIRTYPWIDQKHLVLGGFSEGAQAVAAWRGHEFKAHVLIGTDCRHNSGSPNSPDGVPVLNLVGSKDRWGYGGGCNLSGPQRSSASIVKIFPGLGHGILQSPEVRNDIRKFIESLNP